MSASVRWLSMLRAISWASFCWSIFIAAADDVDFGAGSNRSHAVGRAERMIRALNLVPGVSEAQPLDFDHGDGGSQLVEKELKLDVDGESGSSAGLDDLGQYAGYFKLSRTRGAKMFYFFFESRGNKTTDPLLLWMTGGPGCAGELALFYENGPFKITDNVTLVWNDYGWDKISSIIFVDQPVGTGFSYSTDVRDLRHDEQGVSEDMFDFFQAFFEAHPNYASNPFFVTGESYGGHYVPAVTTRIHNANKNKDGVHINLKGFAVGNGLTQPDIQYESWAEYAQQHGLIGDRDYRRLSRVYPVCATAIELCGSKGKVTCVAAYLICGSIVNSILTLAGNVNYYDIRKECIGHHCYDFSNLERFLNRQSVRDALGVGNRKFVACNPLVYVAMIVDWMRNAEAAIPALLEDGIRLLVYAGEYDLVCNWLGNSRWVTAMDWSGQVGYAMAEWKPFEIDGEKAGVVTEYGPLSFVKVSDAGHMVPMDQPKNSLEMMYRWTRGMSLESGAQAPVTPPAGTVKAQSQKLKQELEDLVLNDGKSLLRS